MLKIKHVPEQLIDVSLTPVLFLLMFTYLFGGAVAGSTDEYLEYLLPGDAGAVRAVHLRLLRRVAQHGHDQGRLDRFRSLPIWRPAPLVGAVVGDSVRYVIASIVVIGARHDHGLRRRRRDRRRRRSGALVVVFVFGLSWVLTSSGC